MIDGKLKVVAWVLVVALTYVLFELVGYLFDAFWPWSLGHPITNIVLYGFYLIGWVLLGGVSISIVFGTIQVFIDRGKPVLTNEEEQRIWKECMRLEREANDDTRAQYLMDIELFKFKKRRPFNFEDYIH